MKSNTFSVHFVVRNGRMDDEGNAPVYAKISMAGQTIFITTNHKIKIKDWNTKKGLPLPKAENFSIVSDAIQALQTRIYKAHSNLTATTESFTLEMLKETMFGSKKEGEKVRTLITTTEEHNRNFEKLVGIKYSEGSMKNYRTSLKYYREFVPLFYSKNDIPLSLVNYKFCEAFFIFLTTKKSCKVNGANKQIQRLRKIMNYAIQQGYTATNPMASYKLQNTPVNKQALTIEELERLQALELNRDVLIHVRDVFLFQAYTGLFYGDVKCLTAADFQLDIKGDTGYVWKERRHL